MHPQSLSQCSTPDSPMDCRHQVPLSMEFSKQEYQSESPVPTPGDLPDPGIEPTSLAFPVFSGRFFTAVALGSPKIFIK